MLLRVQVVVQHDTERRYSVAAGPLDAAQFSV